MGYGNDDTIHITTKGSIETKFISVSFRASVTTTAKTGPDAKADAKQRIEAIKNVIGSFSDRAGIETDRLRTSFAVDVWKDNNYNFKGYKAVYTIAFNARNVSEATALHDALTSISGVESPTPVFNVDDSPETEAKVFEDAADKAKAKFKRQCDALGFDEEQFKVVRWSFIPDHRGGGGKFLSLTTEKESIEVSPGRALLESSYTFEFKGK